MSWSEMWLKANRERCGYDKNFVEVSDKAIHNDITEE